MVRWLREQGLEAEALRDRVRRRRGGRAPTAAAGGRAQEPPGMKRFSQLFAETRRDAPSTRARSTALHALLRRARRPRDAAWAVYFLAGGKPRQVVPTGCAARAALRGRRHRPNGCSRSATRRSATSPRRSRCVLPPPRQPTTRAWPNGSSSGCCRCAAAARGGRRGAARRTGRARPAERFLLFKLIGGGFRVGVSKLLVQRALAAHAGSTPS